ncbi:uncharacterized protein LOC106648503 [Trichogramma pretiosum]|uniref:uncharacterized protein LOC106648503 n=1 Tax=Trichogramma pretiosum TaxID=7493 RepID=UPI0006C9D733|nr:uncharacterized protein LOC106648503 [Trichogramma pretiosum]
MLWRLFRLSVVSERISTVSIMQSTNKKRKYKPSTSKSTAKITPVQKDLTLEEKVEIDKKRILSAAIRLINANYETGCKHQSGRDTGKLCDPCMKERYSEHFKRTCDRQESCDEERDDPIDAEYKSLFLSDNEDDDDYFEQFVKRMEDEFAQREDLKKNNPKAWQVIRAMEEEQISPAPKRRRKLKKFTKPMEQTMAIISRFRNELVYGTESQPRNKIWNSTFNPNEKNALDSKENISSLPSEMGCNGKATAKTKNLNLTNIWEKYGISVPLTQENMKSKLYTPGHVGRWVDRTEPSPTCKSIKSDAATCYSMKDENEVVETRSPFGKNASPCRTYTKSSTLITEKSSPPIDSTGTKSNTVVRFRPSPPEYISCSSYEEKLSDSPSSLLNNEMMFDNDQIIEENETMDGFMAPQQFYSHLGSCDDSQYHQRMHSTTCNEFPSKRQPNMFQYNGFEQQISSGSNFNNYPEHQFIQARTATTIQTNCLFNSDKSETKIDSFLRNFTYNTENRRRKMEFKYEMKVKYF